MNEQLTCSTVTFRHYELDRALEIIASLGFVTADLGALAGLCEHVPPNGTAKQLEDVARVVTASGIAPTSVNSDPGTFNGSDADELVLERIVRLLEFSAEVGSRRLIVTCGELRSGAGATNAEMDMLVGGLNRACEVAAGMPVQLVVEAPYFSRPVNTLSLTRLLLERLDPAIGQAWDVAHVRAAGEDPAATFAEFAGRVSIVHLRDAVPGNIRRAIGFGDIDFGAVLAASHAVGYDGAFVLELETRDAPFSTKEEEVQFALQHLSAAAANLGEQR